MRVGRRCSIPAAEGGQSLVEFALLLPLLLLILLGTIQFGIVLENFLAVVDAAHVGDRVASLGGTCGQVTTAARQAATAAGLGHLSVACPSPRPAAGQPVAVTASYSIPVVVPLFWPLLGKHFPISSTMTSLEEA